MDTNIMLEKICQTPRGDVHCWVSDLETSRPTLAFLHGLTASHALFDRQVEYFEGKYNLIVWDAPAHGKSRPYDGFDYPNAAEVLKSILDAEGIEKAVLVGQSAGGFVAQSFYKLYPDAVLGIVTIGTCPCGPSYYSASDLFWLRQNKWMFKMYPDKTLRRTMAKMCADTERARENMLSMLAVYPKAELTRLMYIGFAGFISEICEMDIKCPVWLMVGEHDKTGKVMAYNKAWHEREGFPLHIIENAAHNANDDKPEAVNMLIERFVREL